jgi:uncharacterized phage protein gp47/JayE
MRRPFTRRQAEERLLELLTSLGFDTTGWQQGRIQKTLITVFSIMQSDLSEVVKALAEFGSNSLARGDALTEHSRSRFQNEKVGAVRTRGPIKLTSTASIPYTIQVGQLVACTDFGVKFRNLTEGTLPAGSVAAPSTLTLSWEAVIAGDQGNVPTNAVRRLLTPLAGVSVANDAGTPWYTVTGADEESDQLLRRRNETKWSRLTVELVAESYENIALDAGAKKVKVSDQNPRGPGTIDVYCAAETNLLSVPEMEKIQAELALRALQTTAAWVHPWPPGDMSRAAVRQPEPIPLSVAATLYHDPRLAGAIIQARAHEALIEFLRKTPLGGWSYGPGLENVVTREDVVEVLQAVEGVRTVVTSFATMSVGTLALVTEGVWTFETTAARA